MLKRRISHTHIVGSQAFSWHGGGLDLAWTQSCMINGPVPGEDLEKVIRQSIRIVTGYRPGFCALDFIPLYYIHSFTISIMVSIESESSSFKSLIL